jgi:hypothetical protein
MHAERILAAAALAFALAACSRPQAGAERLQHDAPPPAPDPALLARLGPIESASNDSLPPGRVHDLLVTTCTRCHASTLITQQRKTPAEWGKTVEKMVGWGAVLADSDRLALVAALAERFPAAEPKGTPAAMP